MMSVYYAVFRHAHEFNSMLLSTSIGKAIHKKGANITSTTAAAAAQTKWKIHLKTKPNEKGRAKTQFASIHASELV